MKQLELVENALFGFDASHDAVHRDVACGNDVQQLAVDAGRRQDAVEDGRSFLHAAEQRAGLDLGAGGEIGRRLEAPQARTVERRNVHPARNKVASLLGVFEQGALHAVENAAEQARPQLHG